MNKTIFVTGIFFGLTAVLLGAFGAHGLEKMVDAKAIETFETGCGTRCTTLCSYCFWEVATYWSMSVKS